MFVYNALCSVVFLLFWGFWASFFLVSRMLAQAPDWAVRENVYV